MLGASKCFKSIGLSGLEYGNLEDLVGFEKEGRFLG